VRAHVAWKGHFGRSRRALSQHVCEFQRARSYHGRSRAYRASRCEAESASRSCPLSRPRKIFRTRC
jgi:hypothetical protein